MDSASVTLDTAAAYSIRSFHWDISVLVRVSYSDSITDAFLLLLIDFNTAHN